MLAEGLRLTLVGMVAVFAFLSLLVGLMYASAAFFAAHGHRLGAPTPAAPLRSSATQQSQDIAVVLAIAEHHARNAET